eukprot:CAMPEP_0178606432 /NCGR_PEP_ID=MMETSP0697-20121206/37082_1 /TAXON_ID=265572 /ORGANISM="Extubocellulus spinifer, Strain CCMP396" /LENGTH=416 /DNA_ID=CAMNT_0020244885 /DNA_START=71 /DNA_END=1322 /DNA_ORIENTATION=+
MTRMSLKILRGVDLLAQDENLLTENSSDPYCEIYLNGRRVARTPTQKQTLNPIFGGPNATVEFDALSDDAEFVVKIYDQDLLKSDDPKSAILDIAAKAMYPNVWLLVQSLDGCEACDSKVPPTNGAHRGPRPSSRPTNRPPRELRESALSALSAGPKLSDAGVGNTIKSLRNMIIASRAPVTLHIYDVSNDCRVANFNAVAKGLNGGIYHAAVEIYGREYSFGGSKQMDVTGIFACKPRKCPMHHYRESQYLGDCDLSPAQVNQIVRKMKSEWMARTYDLFRKNCCFFSKEFAVELGVGSIPEWVYSLANVGAAVDDYRRSSGSDSIEGKKKKKKQQKDKPSGSKNKAKTNSSGAPEWGRAPSRSDSEISEASSEEKVNIAECSHNADLIDNVMAARVQRAYRCSVVNRRSTHVTA